MPAAVPAVAMGLGAAGAAATAIGSTKKKKGEAPERQGFAALPEPVQNAYLQTYLPQVLEANKLPYQAIPMKRANAPQDIFDSQALYELQQYSDAKGGYFSPYTNNAPAAPAGQAGPQINPGAQPPVAPAQSGMDSSNMYLANRFLEQLQPKSKTDNGAIGQYNMVMDMLGPDRSKMGTLGNALAAQNYNGGAGFNINSIVAALAGGK